jgi:hypothetical protein
LAFSDDVTRPTSASYCAWRPWRAYSLMSSSHSDSDACVSMSISAVCEASSGSSEAGSTMGSPAGSPSSRAGCGIV